MRGTLCLILHPKNGSKPLTFEHPVLCEIIPEGFQLFDKRGKSAGELWDDEISATVDASKGDLALASVMLTHLIASKFRPCD